MLHTQYIRELYAKSRGLRPVTVEEAQERFLRSASAVATYWATHHSDDVHRACHGTVFSLLSIFDGTNLGHPAVDLALRPHPEDFAYDMSQGNNYEPDGLVFNADVHLHEIYHHYE